MNEELMKQILPIVEKTKEGILKGVELAQEQMPDLIQQVLAWNFTISLVGCLVGMVLIILPLRWVKPLNKMFEEDSSCPYFFGYAIPMMVGIGMFFGNHTWVKIAVAPKLFLIEYISNLIK